MVEIAAIREGRQDAGETGEEGRPCVELVECCGGSLGSQDRLCGDDMMTVPPCPRFLRLKNNLELALKESPRQNARHAGEDWREGTAAAAAAAAVRCHAPAAMHHPASRSCGQPALQSAGSFKSDFA